MYRDGPFLATGARDKKIILWDAGAGVAIYTFVSRAREMVCVSCVGVTCGS